MLRIAAGAAACMLLHAAPAVALDEVYHGYDSRYEDEWIQVNGSPGRHAESHFRIRTTADSEHLYVHSSRGIKPTQSCEMLDRQTVKCPLGNSDVVVGLLHGGNDSIDVRGTSIDTVFSLGGGADTFQGGAENDYITGGKGPDLLSGRDGDDWLRGHSGADRIRGGRGIDLLSGDHGADQLDVRDGFPDRRARCGPGDDVVRLDHFDVFGSDCEQHSRGPGGTPG